MASCKKRYYKTMCGTENGIRKGKYRGQHYDSRAKNQSNEKTTKRKGKR